MKFHQIVLLVVTLLVTSTDLVQGKHTPPKRFLRVDTPEDEGRVFPVNIPGLGKISNAMKTSKTKELQKLVNAGQSADDSFKGLGLGQVLDFGKTVNWKMVGKFFSNRKFKAWAKYTAQLNQKDPDGAMLATLTSAYGEKNAAIIILLGKDARSSVASRLETAQFYKWRNVDNLENADMALVKALEVPRRKIHAYPLEKSIWENYSKYIINQVMNYGKPDTKFTNPFIIG
ncbi:hypothetical protein P3T76_008437 [Phytophthora citrophthora]|uniref:RxLR effector protein n=1 Tax=Phytophthora citrophthora TaxID=4793 RepID=A0AAD9GKK1_9STRA|nr:hypothetical protein P3T76_008437 [Phytophthora citrophthora]